MHFRRLQLKFAPWKTDTHTNVIRSFLFVRITTKQHQKFWDWSKSNGKRWIFHWWGIGFEFRSATFLIVEQLALRDGIKFLITELSELVFRALKLAIKTSLYDSIHENNILRYREAIVYEYTYNLQVYFLAQRSSSSKIFDNSSNAIAKIRPIYGCLKTLKKTMQISLHFLSCFLLDNGKTAKHLCIFHLINYV